MNIVDISEIRKQIVDKDNKEAIDVEASITLLQDCLFFLGMNDLQILQQLKKDMKLKLEELKNVRRY